MLLKITRWTPSSNTIVTSSAPGDIHLSYKPSTDDPSYREPTHISESHSYICMHSRNTQPHTHMQDGALTTHPLSGTQQGGHVLESEGATSLQ